MSKVYLQVDMIGVFFASEELSKAVSAAATIIRFLNQCDAKLCWYIWDSVNNKTTQIAEACSLALNPGDRIFVESDICGATGAVADICFESDSGVGEVVNDEMFGQLRTYATDAAVYGIDGKSDREIVDFVKSVSEY